jgi:putative drug exporter of the RND superfamily
MRSVRRSLFSRPATRRAKWIVFALWFVAIFVAMSAKLPEKFEDAENNEASSYLPESAESTRALKATEELQKGEIAPAVIIYRRDSGLTQADFATIEADVGKMASKRFPGVIADGETAAAGGKPAKGESAVEQRLEKGAVSEPGCGGPTTEVPGQPSGYAPFVGPTCSTDGKAAIVNAYINAEGEGERLVDPVKFWRNRSATARTGWRRRSPAAPVSPPMRSKSSKGSTGRCCSPRSAS